MESMVILLALFVVKHFVCDFWLQFSYMLDEKGTYGAEGGRHHALTHTAGTFLILSGTIPSIELAVLLAFLDGIVHYHIDWAKTNLTLHLTPADQEFWYWLGIDQALHYLTYVAIIGIIVL